MARDHELPSLWDSIATIAEPRLLARGDFGLEALRWLREPFGGEPTDLTNALEDALVALDLGGHDAEANTAPRTRPSRTVAVGLPRRLVLVGDLHGRFETLRPLLEELGLIDAEGRWCAAPGTTLVQVGDLIDVDFSRQPPGGPGRDVALRHLVETTLATCSLPEDRRDVLLASMDAELVGAVLSWHTITHMMRLEQEAAEAGSQVIVLQGNHEVDLLAGRRQWFPGQKALLAELLGAGDARWKWLAERPLIAVAGPVLAMHGGPTADLSRELDRLELTGAAALGPWLDERAPADWSDPFYREGGSLVSPNRRHDDFVTEDTLVTAWLLAARCDFLAVGHSPFLASDAHTWLRLDDEEIRARAARVERLGPFGNILKLDTDLKRGATAEVVLLDLEAGHLEAVGRDGRRSLLDAGEQLGTTRGRLDALAGARVVVAAVDRLRPVSLIDLEAPGLDGDEVSAVLRANRTLDDEGVRAAVATVLRAQPTSLTHLRDWLEGAQRGDPGMIERVAEHGRRLRAAIDRLVGGAPGGETPRIFLAPDACVVDGAVYRPSALVVADLLAARSSPPTEVMTGELVRRRQVAALKLTHYGPTGSLTGERVRLLLGKDLESWIEQGRRALRAEPAASAVEVTDGGGPAGVTVEHRDHPDVGPSPRVPATAWRALIEANGPAGGWPELADADPVGLRLGDSPFEAGVCELRGPWARLRVVVSADGWLHLADTAFTKPRVSPWSIHVDPDGSVGEPQRTQTHLWTRLREANHGGPVVLYSYQKTQVAALLRRGELEALGAGLEVRGKVAPWQTSPFLFTSPTEAVARSYAPLNPVSLAFEIPTDAFEDLIERGLLRLGVMTSDTGDGAPPNNRFTGCPSASIEAIALDHPGVSALLPYARWS